MKKYRAFIAALPKHITSHLSSLAERIASFGSSPAMRLEEKKRRVRCEKRKQDIAALEAMLENHSQRYQVIIASQSNEVPADGMKEAVAKDAVKGGISWAAQFLAKTLLQSLGIGMVHNIFYIIGYRGWHRAWSR